MAETTARWRHPRREDQPNRERPAPFGPDRPVTRASQAVRVRSIPCTPAEARLEHHSQRNAADRKGVTSRPPGSRPQG